MRDPLSKKITGIAPSGIRKFFDIVNEMEDAISLGVGEPDFDTPWHIRDEGIYSLEKGRTFYTSNAGLKELKIEIAKYLFRNYDLQYDYQHEIVVTVGGSEAIDIAMRAMLEPGDEVLIPMPSYVSYLPCAVLANGVPVPINLKAENDFRLTAEELEAAITPKTKLLVMPFPNNPTGASYNKEQLKAWVDYALKNDSVILYDSAYEAFITDQDLPRSIYAIEGAKECAIEFCSLSKTAGFTGTRFSYTVVPTALVITASNGSTLSLHDMWNRRQSTKFNGTPYIIQYAAARVFTEEGMAECQQNIEYYRENARMIAETLKKKNIWFTGGVNSPYIWFKCPKEMESWEFFDYLLENAIVVGTPGSGFGPSGEGYFRLTAFGSYENTLAALERIKKM